MAKKPIAFGSPQAQKIAQANKQLRLLDYPRLDSKHCPQCKRNPPKFKTIGVYGSWDIVQCCQCKKEFRQKKAPPEIVMKLF